MELYIQYPLVLVCFAAIDVESLGKDLMNPRIFVSSFAIAILLFTTIARAESVLFGDLFISGYNNWVDTYSGTPISGNPPKWRVNLYNNTLMEISDDRAGDGSTNTGDFTPYVLIQDGYTSPSDYTVDARMYTSDDDGFGVVFGCRVNFSNEGLSTANSRAPSGMSIQKVVDGVWTELYRDDQGDVPFVYSLDQPFDVFVRAHGNTLRVEVIKDPDGAAIKHYYSLVVDGTDPHLTGSVAFTNWGSGNINNSPKWSALCGRSLRQLG